MDNMLFVAHDCTIQIGRVGFHLFVALAAPCDYLSFSCHMLTFCVLYSLYLIKYKKEIEVILVCAIITII